jgi:quinol-cytochrome oxidoreductase complex cytochrome b subunit
VKLPFESWKRPVPRHPYRDTVILYGSLAALALVIAALTGVSMVKAVIFTAIAFVGGTIYSCWYWRDRLRERSEEEQP